MVAGDHTTIADVDRAALRRLCAHLGIRTEILDFSAMQVPVPDDPGPDEWALATCRALQGVERYCNPAAGAALFDPSKYADHGVQLEFLEPELRPYPQFASQFLPALSIIDVMMFNSVDEIRGMLKDVRLLRESAAEPDDTTGTREGKSRAPAGCPGFDAEIVEPPLRKMLMRQKTSGPRDSAVLLPGRAGR